MRYETVILPIALEHLGKFEKYHRSRIFDAIEAQLAHDPGVQTKNRKRMQKNTLASWELRVGSHRVFFDIDEPERKVVVIAVGVKIGNQVWIGGEEYEL